MEVAIELASRCRPVSHAFSVGAVIVDEHGAEMARGYSREADPLDHAEEAALRKLPPGAPRLRTATIYSTLEPCSHRRSRPQSCAQLILARGIGRVVIAWQEPQLFIEEPRGTELLREAGIVVVELPELADLAKAPNRHVVPPVTEPPASRA